MIFESVHADSRIVRGSTEKRLSRPSEVSNRVQERLRKRLSRQQLFSEPE